MLTCLKNVSMASAFGHIASVIGFKKLFPDSVLGTKALLLGAISASIPDLDVIAYSFGIYPPDILGHRGLTHSVLFAVIWTLLMIGVFHQKDRKHFLLLGFYYFVCTMSHGVIDTFTTGGDGIALLYPFTEERYFSPYRMIRVSPIGIEAFFSNWGLRVLASEFRYIGIPSMLLYGLGVFLNRRVYRGGLD